MKMKIIREEGAICMYCMSEVGKGIDAVAAVQKWDIEGELAGWFCRDHFRQAQEFEDGQRRKFISYYADHRRGQLSEDQRILYDRITKWS
jgi:copper chaperone CopZ